jgi:hypothetical protein
MGLTIQTLRHLAKETLQISPKLGANSCLIFHENTPWMGGPRRICLQGIYRGFVKKLSKKQKKLEQNMILPKKEKSKGTVYITMVSLILKQNLK